MLTLPHAPRAQDKELRDIRDRVQDKEAELDTLRKAGKNLRERLDEKEVETRGIMDRVSWSSEVHQHPLSFCIETSNTTTGTNNFAMDALCMQLVSV